MTSGQIAVLIVIVLVVVAAGGVAGWYVQRRRTLRRRFGPEYDRVVADQDSRVAGERELLERERRHAELDIRPLQPAARERYAEQWRAVQAQFLEDPAGAVVSGDAIVTQLVGDRGYPTENYEDQLSYLSVEHARPLAHYRDAHDIYLRGQRGEASTEELRQALVHYRELFADLLGDSSLGRPDHDAGVLPAPDRESVDAVASPAGEDFPHGLGPRDGYPDEAPDATRPDPAPHDTTQR